LRNHKQTPKNIKKNKVLYSIAHTRRLSPDGFPQGCDDRDCLIARSRPRSHFRDRDSDRDELKKTRPGPGSHD
jgi:hypothetical protein